MLDYYFSCPLNPKSVQCRIYCIFVFILFIITSVITGFRVKIMGFVCSELMLTLLSLTSESSKEIQTAKQRSQQSEKHHRTEHGLHRQKKDK